MSLVFNRHHVEISYAIPEWFRTLTHDQQKQYLDDHPNSRISKIVNEVGDKAFQSKHPKSKMPDQLKEVNKKDSAQDKLEKRGSPTDFQGPKTAKQSLTGEPRKERRIVVMLDKLAALAKMAKEKGKEMPDFDLCTVTIPGTNLFCAQNKGIPRKEMPQFKTRAVPGSWADKNLKKNKDGEVDGEGLYRKMLEDKGIKTENKSVDVASLKATQSQLVGPKIAGMLQALKEDPQHKGINAPIYVSKDGYIVDGHHRWAALVCLAMADGLPDPVQMEVIQVDKPIEELIDLTNEWADEIGLETKAGKQKEHASVLDNYIKIAADNVSKLRFSDVYRVLNECPAKDRLKLALYIVSKRKDLADEVKEVCEEFGIKVETSSVKDCGCGCEDCGGKIRTLQTAAKKSEPVGLKKLTEHKQEFKLLLSHGGRKKKEVAKAGITDLEVVKITQSSDYDANSEKLAPKAMLSDPVFVPGLFPDEVDLNSDVHGSDLNDFSASQDATEF